MFRWAKLKAAKIDQAVKALGDALDPQRTGVELALYAEVNPASVVYVLLEKSADGTIQHVESKVDAATHIREVWTQFRLINRPTWRAFDLVLLGEEGRHTTFSYPPLFDESVGFERRARRWARTRYGTDGLHALIQRDQDIIANASP